MTEFALTLSAIRDYIALRGKDPDCPRCRDDAEQELIERCKRAKMNRIQDNGLEVWRLRSEGIGGRYRLLVESDPRQFLGPLRVVRVLPEHASGPRT